MSEPTRRRWPLLVVGVVVAVAAAVGIAVWRRPAQQPSLPDGLFLPAAGSNGEFADADHGYILLGRCPTDVCEAWVAATDDGGRTWRAALVPDLTFPRDEGVTSPRASLIVLDATHAALESYDATPFGGPAHHRWFTADGGRAWAEVPVIPVTTVDEIPSGGYAYAAFLDEPAHTIAVRVIRADGSSAVTANPPRPGYPVSTFTNPIDNAPDGSLWIHAGDPPNNDSVFRSNDRGRTWVELSWPDGLPDSGRRYDVEVASGTTVYVVDHGGFRVWRSRDAGQTWEELAVPFSDDGQDHGLGGVGRSDGRLILVHPLFDGTDTRYEYFAITPTGSEFESADFEDYMHSDVPVVGRNIDENLRPSNDIGVRAPDGSWTPLPFACQEPGCD